MQTEIHASQIWYVCSITFDLLLISPLPRAPALSNCFSFQPRLAHSPFWTTWHLTPPQGNQVEPLNKEFGYIWKLKATKFWTDSLLISSPSKLVQLILKIGHKVTSSEFQNLVAFTKFSTRLREWGIKWGLNPQPIDCQHPYAFGIYCSRAAFLNRCTLEH